MPRDFNPLDQELGSRNARMVYLITYSQADVGKVKAMNVFARIIGSAFESIGGEEKHWVQGRRSRGGGARRAEAPPPQYFEKQKHICQFGKIIRIIREKFCVLFHSKRPFPAIWDSFFKNFRHTLRANRWWRVA